MKLSGAQAIVKVLLEQGVDTVFGYPGGQVIPLYNALYDAPLHNVLTAHEQGAIHAADGYARASGRTGVCIATSGPGATNIVTGLATAYLDSVPLVAITGQVQVQHLGRDSFQEIDIVGVTIPITKYNVLVRRPEDLLPTLRQAFHLAQEGRPGPILIDVPSSIQSGEVEWTEPEQEVSQNETSMNIEELLKAAAVTINNAERPVMLVGGGAIHSAAEKEVLAFAKKTGMPVVSTLMGLGVFPGSDEQALGLTGMHGHIASNMAVANADVLVVAGSRFSERVTGDRNRYVSKKTIIQLDIDPSEVDKNVMTALPLVGNLKDTLTLLTARVNKLQIKPWWESIRAWEDTEDQSAKKGDKLTAPWLMTELNRNFQGSDTIFVTDVGQNQMWAAQHLIVDEPRHHLTSGGCGTMGYGLPAAMGAKLARKEAQVVHIAGDGGFKMTGMELYTAVNEGLPLISIVINNSCLGMVRQWQEIFYDKRYSSTLLTAFDFIAFARSCGADGIKATTCEEFKAALAEAKESKKPFVIEAVIDQCDLVIPMVAPGAVLHDFVDPGQK
ncbi:MAG: biosynthetic-type acetolactate synthase large subunit [Negativicutes bacterium]|nr:biosynthetic-type acetolactate synthase large subunit [Negativicutes bacterium]